MASKFTVTFNDATDAALDDMADRQGVSKAHVLRRAVGLLKYLDEEREQGNSIRLRDADGNERELVFVDDV